MVEDSRIINYLVRMVVPMRREFGRSLDVQHFLHDLAYAREVLDIALSSQDPRLREYAGYVEKLLLGPRGQALAVAPPAAPATEPAASLKTAAAPSAETPPEASADDEAEALKARILRKYTSGLR